jgi:hypothetical protein
MYMKYGRNNFVITVKALVVVLEIVSRLLQSLSFVITCALWFINRISAIWIYCTGNDRYANCCHQSQWCGAQRPKQSMAKWECEPQVFYLELFIGCCDPEGSPKSTPNVGYLINPVNPSGHYMYHQVWHSQILRSSHIDIRVLCRSRNKQRLFTYTALTDWFFITKRDTVYCEVRTEYLYTIQISFKLQFWFSPVSII